jgi:hypothetical protein
MHASYRYGGLLMRGARRLPSHGASIIIIDSLSPMAPARTTPCTQQQLQQQQQLLLVNNHPHHHHVCVITISRAAEPSYLGHHR